MPMLPQQYEQKILRQKNIEMVYVASHNMITPLGMNGSDTLSAVRAGRTGLRVWRGRYGLPDPFCASLFSDAQNAALCQHGLTRMESLAVASVRRAVAEAGVDVSGSDTIFVLSTTKGDADMLLPGGRDGACRAVTPAGSAQVICRETGITTRPVVVDNACVSGLSAVILAARLLELGFYRQAVVCGAEVQGRFIISGFQSLKAMSAEPCRPFDINRNGMNAGEAAAAMVLVSGAGAAAGSWRIAAGAVRNDAWHISAPSRQGVGARMALEAVCGRLPHDEIAFISAHGTATLFNDQMEAVAIERAGLAGVPVTCVKGNFGHTMGACGVMETCLSMLAADCGVVLPVKGFEEPGVSGHISVSAEERRAGGSTFVKMLSGFGGCNAALLVTKENIAGDCVSGVADVRVTHNVRITADSVTVDGHHVETRSAGRDMLTELYKRNGNGAPRFFRMDLLCRLGVVASDLLLEAERGQQDSNAGGETADRAVVLIGSKGSLHADMAYAETIAGDDFYPSPEKFVYTLPNIVTGEIAIRNKYHGETEYYMLPCRDAALERRLMIASFADDNTESVIGGWIDCESDSVFECDISIIERI